MNKNLIFIALVIGLFSCHKETFVANGDGLADWAKESHSGLSDPNYDIVFNQDQVNEIKLVFTSDEWEDMQEDLIEVNSGNVGGGMGGDMTFSDQTPLYFAADFYFNDTQWYDVGVRYKGNSSLTASSGKLPFRFNFDYFEDEYPEINDQRFYGFKELAMSSGYKDESLMREKTASDLFRDFGVPAVKTAFYDLYVDQGTGTYQYYGLYTMDEVVFDTFLSEFFGSDSGNCYKPDGNGAAFSDSDFDLDDFEKKNNLAYDSKSDVQCMFDALHASNRTSDPESWRSTLESAFDVDGFIKYLAVNNTIQNWDTYGNKTHNYYLYNDPAVGKLRWIVWDNNESLSSGGGQNSALSFDMSEVGTDWPLIYYIISDPTYEETYKSYISDFISTSFSTSTMGEIYSTQQDLLANSAENEETGYTFLSSGESSFNSAVSTLISHNTSRVSSANTYSSN